MARPHLMQSPTLISFHNHLRTLESRLLNVNYEVHLEVESISVPTNAFSLKEIMKVAYPASHPMECHFSRVSHADMIQKVEYCLHYPDQQQSAFYGLEEQNIEASTMKQLTHDFWTYLEDCIDVKASSIFVYTDRQGIPGYPVFWDFIFLIYEISPNCCVVLHGLASD